MNNLFSQFGNNFLGDFNQSDFDINKLLVIILLLTGKLEIEAIHVYKNTFAVTLGNFYQK